MPQFDVHTYTSQLFWLVVCLSILWMGFQFIIGPRYVKNQEARRQAFDDIYTAIEKHQENMRRLYEQSTAVIEEAAQKARNDFNKVRHILDQEDQKLHHEGVLHHREALQKHLQDFATQGPVFQEQTQEIAEVLKPTIRVLLKKVVRT